MLAPTPVLVGGIGMKIASSQSSMHVCFLQPQSPLPDTNRYSARYTPLPCDLLQPVAAQRGRAHHQRGQVLASTLGFHMMMIGQQTYGLQGLAQPTRIIKKQKKSTLYGFTGGICNIRSKFTHYNLNSLYLKGKQNNPKEYKNTYIFFCVGLTYNPPKTNPINFSGPFFWRGAFSCVTVLYRTYYVSMYFVYYLYLLFINLFLGPCRRRECRAADTC